MQESLNIMKVCVRVLAAVNRKTAPDAHDVEMLRKYLGWPPPADVDELACAVIGKAVMHRAEARTAMKRR